jgi:hypothetical protein
MDGYSVQEAASVLGIAEGRVWELLARGVISGTPDGDSMRVFLKTQAGPIAPAGARDEPPRTNGNGGSHAQSGEASAFRELLTEFRNLTERYGQALLALGEARGEVAGLRSRVDLLEARLDLRVAAPMEASTISWEAPVTEAAPASERAAEAVAPPSAPPSGKSRARKRRTTRDAMAGFTDALARAQDPGVAAVADVPASEGDEEAPSSIATAVPETEDEPIAEASATLEAEPEAPAATEAEPAEAEPAAAEAAEPVNAEIEAPESAEVAAAEAPEPADAEVEAPSYSSVVVEPDWFADGDFAWLEAAEIEAQGQSEAVAEPEPMPSEAEAVEVVQVVAAEPEPVEPKPEAFAEVEATPAQPEALEVEPELVAKVEAAPEPDSEPMPSEPEALEAVQEAVAEPEPVIAAAVFEPLPSPEASYESQPEFEPWRQVEPEVEPQSPAPEATSAPDGPPTTTATAVGEVDSFIEEEVMWLGAETNPSPPPAAQSPQPEMWPAGDRVKPVATPVVETVRPPLAMTEDELTRLALDEGWDEAEVAAIRAMITPPRLAVDLPGGSELDEAMAALDAVPIQPDAQRGSASRQWVKPAADENQSRSQDPWAFEAEAPAPFQPPSEPPVAADQDATPRDTPTEPGWLGRRQGTAASAYRRLRRLFPG